MALALARGVAVPGLAAAVERTARWLVDHRADDEWGVNWPSVTPLPGTAPVDRGSRAAWCYGAPGIARALWLSGVAMRDAELRDLAVDAMAAVYRRPVSERHIDSPTFCHGIAGLLQVTLRFAQDTGLPLFHGAAPQLFRQLLAAYDPERPLGSRHWSRRTPRWVDQPGLLDGAPRGCVDAAGRGDGGGALMGPTVPARVAAPRYACLGWAIVRAPLLQVETYNALQVADGGGYATQPGSVDARRQSRSASAGGGGRRSGPGAVGHTARCA